MGSERMLILPTIYIIALWVLFINPTAILQKTPPIPFISGRVTSIDTLLPLHPKTLHESYILGQLEGKLSLYDGKADEESKQITEKMLSDVATLFNRPSITREEMKVVEKAIQEYEKDSGVVQRVKGLFSFINLVWLLSILGICITIGPVLALIARPLVAFLVRVFTDVIIPLLIALQPLYEVLAYFICFLFVANGLKTNPDTGFFISLTGALLFIPSFVYSTFLHSSGGGNKELYAQIFNILIAIELAPVAILHQSTLIGFFAVVAVFGALGFSVVCTGLCYYIGFQDGAMPRAMAASLFFIMALTIVKIVDIPAKYLAPFTTGLMTMGSVVYFLALLIMSSRFYRRSGVNYSTMQFVMVASLTSALFFGSVFSIAPLYNTACTYAVFYAMEKTVEFGSRHPGLFWFMLLGGSVVLYVISLFLHNHPGFIISMVDGSWVLK